MATPPVDSATVTDDDVERLDLGFVRIPVRQGLEVRVDIDEHATTPSSVSLFLGHSIIALQAFATPRYEDMWPGVRDDIVSRLREQGISCDVVLGAFGTEVHSVMPTVDYDGSNVVQSVRFLGVDGPRWFLRIVVSGDGAVGGAAMRAVDEVVSELVVHRGDSPMAPGEPLAVVLPDEPGA